MHQIFYRVARWVLLATLFALACFFVYTQIYLVYGPKVRDVDARLPTPFHSTPGVFWLWLLGSSAAGGVSGYWAIRVYRTLRRGPAAVVADPEGIDAELELAWQEISNLRRGHEDEPAFLIFAEGDAPAALLASGGLRTEAIAPGEGAPLSGLRSPEGLFLHCTGAGSGTVADAARFACQALAAIPENQAPRAIVIQVSPDLLMGPKARAFGQATRAGLRAAAESTATRCPTYVIVSGMEGVPGFLEFARRRPSEFRTAGRFGFSMPGGVALQPDSLAREYDRLIDWCDRSTFDLMEAGPLQHDGNEALFAFVRWFRRARGPMLAFLDLAMPVDDDPHEIVGCYFAATGPTPDEQAYAESLMRFKIVGDTRPARWSRQTLDADRVLRRAAILLGTVGGLAAATAWLLIFQGLHPSGWFDPALASAIIIAWAGCWYVLLRGFKRAQGGH